MPRAWQFITFRKNWFEVVMERSGGRITESELRDAFRRSGLQRSGWTLLRAIECNAVYISLRVAARAMRDKEQNGKSAPIRRAF